MPNMTSTELDAKFADVGPGLDNDVMDNFAAFTNGFGRADTKRKRVIEFAAKTQHDVLILIDLLEF